MSNSLPFYIPIYIIYYVRKRYPDSPCVFLLETKMTDSLRFHMLQPMKYLPFQLAEA